MVLQEGEFVVIMLRVASYNVLNPYLVGMTILPSLWMNALCDVDVWVIISSCLSVNKPSIWDSYQMTNSGNFNPDMSRTAYTF